MFLVSMSEAGFSQIIYGIIKDAKTNEALIGATVVVKGTNNGTQTDADGKFELTVTGFSSATIVITYLGYENKEVAVNDFSKKLSILLQASNVTLNEIVVQDSRLTDKQRESALTVESMDLLAIKQTPAFNFYEGLGQLKGVDITTASLGFRVINTRGFNSTSPVRSLQIIDGVDNQSPGLNFSLGNFLGASELDVVKVDLVVGASSAFYGPNAFNGVISMTTKDPFYHPGFSVMTKTGERGLFETAVRWDQVIKNKAGKDKFAYKLNLYYLRANDWEAKNYAATEQSPDGVNNPGGYDAVNRYGDEFNSQYDQTGNSGIKNQPGLNRYYRTGYNETDLVDYNTRNLKLSSAFHYKIHNETELIFSSNFGTGTTVYQGDNRYSLKNILFLQNRVEVRKKDKFFLRAYSTNEDAGNSYDAYFTALLLQKLNKTDVNWGIDYSKYYTENCAGTIQSLDGYPQFIPGHYLDWIDSIAVFLDNPELIPLLDSLHQACSNYANDSAIGLGEQAFYHPGTASFDSAFNSIISKKSYGEGGSMFFDKSALYHLHGEYKFTPKFIEITIGANYRLYRPNSEGTIFVDTGTRKIKNNEFGIYTGFEKKILDDKWKFNFAIRMDKNQNFDYLFSPAASAIYNLKKHTFRVSFSSAIRNPTLTDQYLYYNVGRAKLLGNISGYDSLITLSSLYNFLLYKNLDTLRYFNTPAIKPEQVKTIEVGYRAILFKHLFVDVGYYYSYYKNFIGYKIGASVKFNSFLTNEIDNLQVYRVSANADAGVTTQGFSAGLNYYFKKHYGFNANYSWNVLNKQDTIDPIIPAFNTPENKFNIGMNARDLNINLEFLNLHIHNFGFSVNYKWVEGFNYEGSPQFTGFIPNYGLLDIQLNKEIPKISMTVKIGASNLLNNSHYEVYGGPYIGRMAYFSLLFEPKKNK